MSALSALWLVFTAEDAWCAKTQDENQYIQVDFLIRTRVTRVGILRRQTKDHWVSEYSLQYSDDDITWIDYMENGHVKVSEDSLLLNRERGGGGKGVHL